MESFHYRCFAVCYRESGQGVRNDSSRVDQWISLAQGADAYLITTRVYDKRGLISRFVFLVDQVVHRWTDRTS